MDKLTIKRIKTLHPNVRNEALKMYRIANNKLGKYVRLRFSWTYRFGFEQAKLYNQRPKVTNAKAGYSVHEYGLAFDIVLLYDKDRNGTFETASWNTIFDGDNDNIADWLEVTKVFLSYGWKNGFLRNGRKWDKPHFQKTNGLKARDLKKIVDNGNVIKEVINNEEYIYPKLCKCD
ncbi:MAG TPA: M15 family peptidase [Crocinitomix sp.]|nr:M15 family peptidase [Crocinitomix sp.]